MSDKYEYTDVIILKLCLSEINHVFVTNTSAQKLTVDLEVYMCNKMISTQGILTSFSGALAELSTNVQIGIGAGSGDV